MKLIESAEVIHRTDDGSTVTAVKLTPEARAGLSTNGAEIPASARRPMTLRTTARIYSTVLVAFVVAVYIALYVLADARPIVALAVFGGLLVSAAVGGLCFDGGP